VDRGPARSISSPPISRPATFSCTLENRLCKPATAAIFWRCAGRGQWPICGGPNLRNQRGRTGACAQHRTNPVRAVPRGLISTCRCSLHLTNKTPVGTLSGAGPASRPTFFSLERPVRHGGGAISASDRVAFPAPQSHSRNNPRCRTRLAKSGWIAQHSTPRTEQRPITAEPSSVGLERKSAGPIQGAAAGQANRRALLSWGSGDRVVISMGRAGLRPRARNTRGWLA